MSEVGTHPDQAQLTAFGLGQLDEAPSAAIESHVAECVPCQALVEAACEDSLITLLRSAARPDEEEGPPRTTSQSTVGTPHTCDAPAALADHTRYRVRELLGVGGMGAVYRAEHLLMARPVALKIINKGLINNAAAVERFRREVQAAARLVHANIVTAYDADQAGEAHFLVMEYVEGQSLARLLAEKGPLPVRQACDYIRQAALGLQHAHEQGMVHRDIKPHNLMLTPDGRVKILDFGLARFARENAPGTAPRTTAPAPEVPAAATSEPLTELGTVMGTPDYIAPEQAVDAHAADIRADIYSLGCTLYDLMAGHAPFPEGTAIDKVLAHAERQPRPLTELRKDVPPALAHVVERMMAKDPARRYQTPVEVARALVPFAGGSMRRRRWLPAVVGIAILVAALALVAYLYSPTLYRIATNQGEVLVEVIDEPGYEDLVSKGVLVREPAGQREYLFHAGRHALQAGDYELVVEEKGVHLLTREFTIARGSTVPVRVDYPILVDKLKIQGTWIPLSRDDNGEWKDDLTGGKYVFDGDTFTMEGGGLFDIAVPYDLDAAARPKRIHMASAVISTGMEGIYSLEGDELKLCIAGPFGRPRDFVADADSGQELVVLRREHNPPGAENPKEQKARLDITHISEALESYRKDAGDYPERLDALLKATADKPAYLEFKELIDPWGVPYVYEPQNRNPQTSRPRVSSTRRTGGLSLSNW
jgi:uncharacterized protein (TIGR03067 family)